MTYINVSYILDVNFNLLLYEWYTAFMYEKNIYTICAHGQMARSASCLLYTGFGRKYVFVIFWHGEMCMLHDSGKKKLLVWKCIKCALHLSTTTVTYPDHGATMHLKNGLKRKQEIIYSP